MEILAPAGDIESLKAAINSGADAVYFGASNFNARRNADNFTDSEFKDALLYCRKNGVKSHIVLNTLLNDGEIDEALKTATFAAQNGADAFIVQDTGLAMLLRNTLPFIPLHASTQLTIHSDEGIYFAKQMGFDRVVLSRELTLKEIEHLTQTAKSVGIETEVFIHGALCMCMSGQCYLSSMIGTRSGNRGLCAQPCRLPFGTEEGYGYALSLKDMCHLDYINQLIKTGVASFKIEGRMKDAEYVASAVFAARSAREKGSLDNETRTLLASAFSRSGFCDGYITGKRNDMFGIRTEKDSALTKEVQNSIHELYRREFQRIGTDMHLICRKNLPAELTVSDDNFSVTVKGDTVTQSNSRPLTEDFAKEKLSKLGGTPYFAKSVTVQSDDDAYIPISALNALKKQAIELLAEKRCEKVAPTINLPILKKQEHIKKSLGIRARFNNILPNDLSCISRAYLTHTSDNSLFERLIQSGIETGVELPRVFFNGSEKIRDRLLELKNMGVKYALCDGHSALYMAQQSGFICDMGGFSQIMNSYSCLAAKSLNADSIILSFEATVEQINSISSPVQTGYIGYGFLPLMMTRCCPLKNSRDCKNCNGGYLTDRKNKRFFVKCRDGVSELFNSVPLEMCNKQSQFNTDFVLLYFTFEKEQEIQKEINDWVSGHSDRDEFTHGLYYRGVL